MDKLEAPAPARGLLLRHTMTDEEISKVKDLLLEQLQAVRPHRVFVTEENLVAAAHLVSQDQAGLP